MLSDAIRQMRERFKSGAPDDLTGLMLTLKAFELEAVNMESRIEILSGQPHIVLDGKLISTPLIEIGGKETSP